MSAEVASQIAATSSDKIAGAAIARAAPRPPRSSLRSKHDFMSAFFAEHRIYLVRMSLLDLLNSHRSAPPVSADTAATTCPFDVPRTEAPRCEIAVRTEGPAHLPVGATGDLFGAPAATAAGRRGGATVPQASRVPAQRSAPAAGDVDAQHTPPLLPPVTFPVLSSEEVASWKALGVEILLDTPMGELWMVPEYTDKAGKERREVTPEDAAKIASFIVAFPGAYVADMLPLSAEAAENGCEAPAPPQFVPFSNQIRN
jgi:hypothetical protein